MPHPSWPVDLPYKPRRDQYKISPRLPPIETEMEGGNVRQRSRPGDDVRIIEQTLRFTDAQYAAWNTFYLANGTGRISMPVFLAPSYVTSTVQIIGVPDASKDGLKWQVPMKLRVYGA